MGSVLKCPSHPPPGGRAYAAPCEAGLGVASETRREGWDSAVPVGTSVLEAGGLAFALGYGPGCHVRGPPVAWGGRHVERAETGGHLGGGCMDAWGSGTGSRHGRALEGASLA